MSPPWGTPDPDAWQITFLLAMVCVVIFDANADRIPGVAGKNRIHQFLALLSMASAMSTLFEVKFFASLPNAVDYALQQVASGFGISWNIAGLILLAWFGWKSAKSYMESEEIFWDGFKFGLVVLLAASVFPFINNILELWRVWVINGIGVGLVEFTGLFDKFGFTVG